MKNRFSLSEYTKIFVAIVFQLKRCRKVRSVSVHGPFRSNDAKTVRRGCKKSRRRLNSENLTLLKPYSHIFGVLLADKSKADWKSDMEAAYQVPPRFLIGPLPKPLYRAYEGCQAVVRNVLFVSEKIILCLIVRTSEQCFFRTFKAMHCNGEQKCWKARADRCIQRMN